MYGVTRKAMLAVVYFYQALQALPSWTKVRDKDGSQCDEITGEKRSLKNKPLLPMRHLLEGCFLVFLLS